ncbi:hypothetical protein M441DRAFT_396362 [Trichoderma asperellum CBS 433.97]|uniref:Uncharacterized protein n=1 Tax=Trichoderma asperellum (strain ATCC 204424 / CBS 433.97 / NBRC 101777) TaxID=1042311 RepID=A0A2T3Z914_TRIA4|nr:hypothetical protein M441DRAFT_396362 [Trichoderma asperellum CBS 433.97]PTB41298.1 hypothetical protein M441DRAFT_396362 [Trichoderma asperellum CBS 433.97]
MPILPESLLKFYWLMALYLVHCPARLQGLGSNKLSIARIHFAVSVVYLTLCISRHLLRINGQGLVLSRMNISDDVFRENTRV